MHKGISAHYYMHEAMPLVICGACLNLVLESSEKAREIYKQIVESYRLPDIQAMLHKLELELPPGSSILKGIKKDLGAERTKGKDKQELLLPDGDFLKNTVKKASGYTHIFEKWFDLEKEKIISTDFRYWHGLIEELIRVGFNNESEQARGIYKVTGASSPVLFYAIQIRSLAEHRNVQLVMKVGKKAINIDGTTYDLSRFLVDNPTSRKHRVLTKGYKQAGYKRHQDAKIIQVAEYWYYSRVVFSGPQELCNQLLKKGVMLDASNLSNEIRDCDIAIGYPRGN